MVTKHIAENGTVIDIKYMAHSGCYLIYQNGSFVESLDQYDIEDMKRLKMWERL